MGTQIQVFTCNAQDVDYMIVHETSCGETIYAGGRPCAAQLFAILCDVSGLADEVTFHDVTPDRMQELKDLLDLP